MRYHCCDFLPGVPGNVPSPLISPNKHDLFGHLALQGVPLYTRKLCPGQGKGQGWTEAREEAGGADVGGGAIAIVHRWAGTGRKHIPSCGPRGLGVCFAGFVAHDISRCALLCVYKAAPVCALSY